MDNNNSITMGLYRCFKRQRTPFISFCVLLVFMSSMYFMSASWIKICWIRELRDSKLQRWIAFDHVPPFPEEWYTVTCFSNVKQHEIEKLEENLKYWKRAEDTHCREMYDKFNTIYTVEHRTGEVEIPSPFQKKIFQWLGNTPDAIQWIKKQVVYHITNKYTRQRTIHTPLRSKRPKSESSGDALLYIMKTAKETQKSCDFCTFSTNTAYDTFGRYETKLAFTSSNAFKMDKWHGLVSPKKHNFLNLTGEDVVDMFMLAQQWFNSAHNISRDYRFPMVNWDSTPHAGASQFHPHMHTFLDSSGYYGIMDVLCRAAQNYAGDQQHSNYFTDLVTIHHLLGLSVRLGNATAIVELTERGDGEFTILSQSADSDLYLLLFYIIRTYIEELGIYAFSAGIAFPNMQRVNSKDSLPAIVRITTRGDVNNFFSDISGFDLYLSPNTSRDPYSLIEKLRTTIKKYEEKVKHQ